MSIITVCDGKQTATYQTAKDLEESLLAEFGACPTGQHHRLSGESVFGPQQVQLGIAARLCLSSDAVDGFPLFMSRPAERYPTMYSAREISPVQKQL